MTVVGMHLIGAWWPVCDGCRDAAYRSMMASVCDSCRGAA